MTQAIAFYDLEYGPVSYDNVTWLMRAKMWADEQGLPLHAVIVPKEDGLGGFARFWGDHDAAATRFRLWHIVVPAAQLVGATITLAPSRAFAKSMKQGTYWWEPGKCHFLGPIVEAARRGAKVPRLTPSEAAMRFVDSWKDPKRKLLTVTVRNQTTDARRNTDPRAADQIIRHAIGNGWDVVKLDDTNVALKTGATGAFAEVDLDMRAALYASADMNFISCNGPIVLLQFLPAPYRLFDIMAQPGEREHYAKYIAFQPGDQLPWATPQQLHVYERGSFEVMKREFDAISRRI